jgi:hypothetical protein
MADDRLRLAQTLRTLRRGPGVCAAAVLALGRAARNSPVTALKGS